jgi:glucose/mannose-6-phosphate isomerase
VSTDPTRAWFDLAAALPEHLLLGADAARDLRGLPQRSDIETIVILGVGAGRSAGDAVRALGVPTIEVPILVQSSYALPACVGRGSLVFAISGSGNTDEVNHAAAASLATGARLVAVSVGGWLVDFAHDNDLPLVRIPKEVPAARMSFGAVVASLLTILKGVDFLPEATVWIESAVAQLRRRRDQLSQKDNLAEPLAASLLGRHVLCQGDTPIGVTAAERWKAQINQNAKQAASVSAQPNASHNEAVAWDCRNDLTMQRDAAVLLRHGFEDRRVSQSIDRLAQYLNGKVPIHQVRGQGDTPMAVLMDLAMVGDYTSLHLAKLNGVDPGAVRFISHTLKEGLVPPERRKQTTRS